jgi:hypothetical protein
MAWHRCLLFPDIAILAMLLIGNDLRIAPILLD